jgi:cytochrome c-type biogenesis protein CcmF
MIATIGHIAIVLAFIAAVLSTLIYIRISNGINSRLEPLAKWMFYAKGWLVLIASGALLTLLFQHQFQYYYVFNYTSKDLQDIYIWASFYSGQEGSLLLWILFTALVGWGLIRWTEPTYKAPVMTFMSVTQVFLISMVLGVEILGSHFGASPFRLLREQMPNAPIFMNNPDFIPADGSGLNDLLRSPWIVIHPPVLFLGFAMMTVPFAFALAAVWKKQFREWVRPALPWALAANVCLLTAIFLGGYWAYVTLSFGGYWAWDPVENASLVPWLVGTAGIHTMLIQRKRDTGVISSIVFAVLAFVLIVYSTFLTRSGILGEASVHSFVDLGLYNQLLTFMLSMVALGAGFIFWRLKDMPSVTKDAPVLSRDFMAFAAAMTLFLLGLVIIVGTSSPILGRLFVDNPTPPDIQFYTNWSLPFGVAIAIMTVIGQLVWWKRTETMEDLANRILIPLVLASVVTIAIIIWAEIRDIAFMVLLLAAFIGLFGNGAILLSLLRRNPKLIGGSISHIGFAFLMIGFLGAAYDRPLLDEQTVEYNKAVMAGSVIGNDGFPVMQPIEIVELRKNEPKLLGERYMVTFMEAATTNRNRPGEQEYTIKLEDMKSGRPPFFMVPTVYPMIANANAGNVNWTVDPEVRTGWTSDIYLYVAGSSMVERERERMSGVEEVMTSDSTSFKMLKLKKDQSAEADGYEITFRDFDLVDLATMPENTTIAVRAMLDVKRFGSDSTTTISPLFSIIRENGQSMTSSDAVDIGNGDIQVQFTNVNPSTGEIELRLAGVNKIVEPDWVLLTIERKPMVAVVWLGTFLLMIGFSIAILRRWNETKGAVRDEATA